MIPEADVEMGIPGSVHSQVGICNEKMMEASQHCGLLGLCCRGTLELGAAG